MENLKYPRTFHLPFSPEIHSDDKTLKTEHMANFLNRDIVITEKLDGGNACLKNGKVYARTHAAPASHPSFDTVKNLYAGVFPIVGADYDIYGENMTAVHTIEYGRLESYFYAFAILQNGMWLSFDELAAKAAALGLKTVPVLYRGKFRSAKEIQSFMDSEIKNESILGGEREGFVIRAAEGFAFDHFSQRAAKYVRRGHVQSDERWETNWIKAKLIKCD